MARLEDLVRSIPDAELRAQIEAEVSGLKSRTSFGLVYERHLPETALVLDIDGLRPGDLARPRHESDNGRDYRVEAINGETATLQSLNGAEQQEVLLSDLLAIKRFGDPADAALESLGSISRSDERPYHTVINGENFHALQMLTLIYEGQVDCIYIDPPYNSGARDWKYNNRFVDSADAYRHSKWLSFMEKRLRLAKRLLKPDGVLIVTIDENEVYHLGMLLEELFSAYLRYHVTIVVSAQGNAKANFSRVEEYAIFCVPNTGDDVITGSAIDLAPTPAELDFSDEDEGEGEDESGPEGIVEDGSEPTTISENARRRGTESLRQDRPNMFYPIYIDEEARRVVSAGPPINLDEPPAFTYVDGLRPVWPIDSNGHERRWRWGYDTMVRLIGEGQIRVGNYNARRDIWTINRVQPQATAFRKLKTVWRHTSHSAGTHGSGLLARLLGRGVAFSFPKSVYATRDCLAAVCRTRPHALILDFFAGSGTTLHSTLLLNAADGGNRRCVMVTNNEVDSNATTRLKRRGVYPGTPDFEAHGIFEAVTRPRCSAAITGVRPDGQLLSGNYLDGRPLSEGFAENVEFFRLDYLDPDQIDLGNCFDRIHPLLWLAAGARARRPEIQPSQPFLVSDECGYAVLLDEEAFPRFEAALAGHNSVTHVFLVTDSEEAYAEMCERVGPGRETMMLYRDFLRNYRRLAT